MPPPTLVGSECQGNVGHLSFILHDRAITACTCLIYLCLRVLILLVRCFSIGPRGPRTTMAISGRYRNIWLHEATKILWCICARFILFFFFLLIYSRMKSSAKVSTPWKQLDLLLQALHIYSEEGSRKPYRREAQGVLTLVLANSPFYSTSMHMSRCIKIISFVYTILLSKVSSYRLWGLHESSCLVLLIFLVYIPSISSSLATRRSLSFSMALGSSHPLPRPSSWGRNSKQGRCWKYFLWPSYAI
jgi:hypothetical protein